MRTLISFLAVAALVAASVFSCKKDLAEIQEESFDESTIVPPTVGGGWI